jgi:hypothetical protein
MRKIPKYAENTSVIQYSGPRQQKAYIERKELFPNPIFYLWYLLLTAFWQFSVARVSRNFLLICWRIHLLQRNTSYRIQKYQPRLWSESTALYTDGHGDRWTR